MPRIPTVNRPELGPHQDSTVPLSGAPGLNWRTDNGLQQLGDAMAKGSGAIGDMMLQGVNASLVLAQEKQRADDEDNLSEIQLRAQQKYGDLQSRMRENPNSYEQFNEWGQLSTQELGDEVKPFLGKLSTRARTRAEHLLRETAYNNEKYTRDIAFQADITMKRGSYDMRIREYAKRGDTEQARAQLALAIDTGIFNPNETETYGNFIDELDDFGAVERRIEANDLNILDDLKKQDKEGNHTEYTRLTSSDRRQLSRYAEQKKARREVELQDAFVAEVLAGKPITEEQVLQRNDITQGTKNDFIKILRGVQSNKAKQQTAEQKQARQYARDAFEFEIMEHRFSPDPVERDKEYAAFNRRIHVGFVKDDPAHAKQLKTQLNESLKAATKPDTSYKKSASYQYGENLIDQLATQGKFFAQKPGRMWGTNDAADKPITQYTEKLVRRDLDNYLRNHPNATEKEVRDVITTMTEDYNKTLVDELAERSIVHSRANAKAIPKEGQTGNYNGKKVIFKNGGWEYAE